MDIVRLIKKVYLDSLQVPPSAEGDERILGDALRAMKEANEPERATIVPNSWRMIMKSRIAKIAAAAVIIFAVCLFLARHGRNGQIRTPGMAQTTDSPGQFTTLASINIAFRDGGIEAVEKQFARAFKMLGPRPNNLTAQDLYAELSD